MRRSIRHLLAGAVIGAIGTGFVPAFGQTVLDEWKAVQPPPPPAAQAVTVDPGTTALLLLDFNKQTCNAERRPRCVASVPKAKKLLADARSRGMAVLYSLSPGASAADIAPDLAPRPDEAVISSGPDKFLGTDLEKLLRDRGIRTVIVAGTAAHGAVLHTAAGAALRGLKVVVPADVISSETLYPEQYALWHLLNAPRIGPQTTMTRADLISY
jgi:nicotinamidase-related amidase